MNLGKRIYHKEATEISPNVITALSQYNSAGFYYEVRLEANQIYMLHILAELLDGDKAFIYAEHQNNILIERKYFIKKNKTKLDIKFSNININGIARLGILFWNKDIKYIIKVYNFSLEVYKQSSTYTIPKNLVIPPPTLLYKANSHKKVLIIIYTYNRFYMINNLLYILHNNIIDDLNVKVLIYDDGSEPYPCDINNFNLDVIYHKFDTNHGKLQWYRMISNIYKDLRKYEFDYTISIPDDCCIKIDFIKTCIDKFEIIKNYDQNYVTLTLNNDRDKCWTNFDKVYIGNDIYLSQWVEMCFIADRKYYQALAYSLDDFVKPKVKSSGVPCFITNKLFNLKLNMYLVKNSLIYISNQNQSQMNNDFNDGRLNSRGYY